MADPMDAKLIFRTASAAALDAFGRLERLMGQQGDLRAAFEREVIAAHGPAALPDHAQEARKGRRSLILSGWNRTPVGVDAGFREVPPMGSGWRLDATRGGWRPDLRTKAGKAMQERLRGLTLIPHDDLRDALGIPTRFPVVDDRGQDWLTSGALDGKDARAGVLYAWCGYGTEEALVAFETAQSKRPDIVWEPVKRSAWIARLEEREAA